MTTERKQIVIDDAPLVDQTIEDADLIYRGGNFVMTGCTLKNCHYKFDGAAGQTVHVLRALYAEPGTRNAAKDVIDFITGGDTVEIEGTVQ